MNHPSLHRPFRAMLLVSSLAAVTGLRAQSDDTVVRLDEFNVNATATSGYQPSETTTGTRMAAKIQDLPFVVTVIPKDFFEDFDILNVTGSLDVSSLTGLDTEGNYSMRGFPGTFNLWNGFYSLGLVDPAMLDHTDVLKGPMAGIYGQTSPAGIVNMNTRVASFTPYQDMKLMYGSFGTWRVQAHADVAGTVAGMKVANLVTVAGTDTTGLDSNDESPWAYSHQRAAQEAFQIAPNDHSSIIGEIDWYKKLENTADNNQLYNYNSATKAYYGTLAPIALARFSQGGPNERQNREMTNERLEYENRFSEHWSLRMRGYGYDRHNSEDYNGTSNEWDPVLGEVVGISTKPTRTILNEDGGAAQADLLANYKFGNVQTKTLATLDWSENWRFRQGTTLPTTLTALLPSVQNPNAPVYTTVPDYPAWTIVNRNDKVRWDTLGGFVSEQVDVSDKLFLYGSIRHDQVTYNLNFGNQYNNKAPFALSAAGQVQHFVNTAWTPAGGANYKLTENVALYANYSQSFQASAQGAKLGDPQLPNTRGSGVDFGTKFTFLNGRLVGTVGGFNVTETGIKISVLQPDGTTDTEAAGSQKATGVESDLSYQVTDAWSVGAGFGYDDGRLLNEGTNYTADHRRPPNVPIDNGYLHSVYRFGGALTGLQLDARYEYVGISYPQSTATTAGENNLRLPAFSKVDGGISYSWKTNFANLKLSHQVKFFVANALNADYVNANGTPQPERGYYVSYTLKH